ncbi:MAG: hypothetical protein WBO31_08435 [Saprospiraceae bacterium]
MARDCAYWMPCFRDNSKPADQAGELIPGTESEFEYYCEWLTDYLTKYVIEAPDYQLPSQCLFQF